MDLQPTIVHVYIEIIFLCMRKSQLHNTQKKLDWLFNTQLWHRSTTSWSVDSGKHHERDFELQNAIFLELVEQVWGCPIVSFALICVIIACLVSTLIAMFYCDTDEDKEENVAPVPKPRRKFVMTESSFRHMVEIIGRSDKYIHSKTNATV